MNPATLTFVGFRRGTSSEIAVGDRTKRTKIEQIEKTEFTAILQLTKGFIWIFRQIANRRFYLSRPLVSTAHPSVSRYIVQRLLAEELVTSGPVAAIWCTLSLNCRAPIRRPRGSATTNNMGIIKWMILAVVVRYLDFVFEYSHFTEGRQGGVAA